MEIKERNIYIFCDGGSRMSKNLASFSSVVLLGDLAEEQVYEQLSLDRVYNKATNNQMELSGFISTMVATYLKMNGFTNEENPEYINRVVVTSDSQYLVKGVNEYLPNWKKNGYRTASRKPIANKELWHILERILEMYSNVEFEFVWTKGHADLSEDNMDYATKYNNICDENCNIIMDSVEDETYEGRVPMFEEIPPILNRTLDDLEKAMIKI